MRARALAAWGEVLRETGFEDVPSRPPARRTEFSRSATYPSVPEREALFFEYIEDRVAAFVEALRNDIAAEKGAADRLRRLAVGELYRFADAPSAATSTAVEPLGRAGRARLRACFEPLRSLVSDALEERRREGGPSALDVDNATKIVFGCVDVFRARLARQWLDADDIAADIADHVLRGLGAPRSAVSQLPRTTSSAALPPRAAVLPGR